MTRFTWTEADKAKLVPGATVVIASVEGVRDGRYVVADFTPPGGLWIAGGDIGVGLSYVDPRSVEMPTQRALVAVEL